ncbi:hypothetical protein ACFE04_021795 [Oxalis oulophora]
MFSSPKGKGKNKSSITHKSAIRAIYDHNESQITWAQIQYDNLKSDMITMMSRMRTNQLNKDAMNRILIQPTSAVKAHEVFCQMISEETDEDVPKQTQQNVYLQEIDSRKEAKNTITWDRSC